MKGNKGAPRKVNYTRRERQAKSSNCELSWSRPPGVLRRLWRKKKRGSNDKKQNKGRREIMGGERKDFCIHYCEKTDAAQIISLRGGWGFGEFRWVGAAWVSFDQGYGNGEGAVTGRKN